MPALSPGAANLSCEETWVILLLADERPPWPEMRPYTYERTQPKEDKQFFSWPQMNEATSLKQKNYPAESSLHWWQQMLGKIEGMRKQGQKRMRLKKRKKEDEMVGWHHQLNRHEFEQTPGDSEGPGSWHAAVHGVAKSQTRLNNKKKCISS